MKFLNENWKEIEAKFKCFHIGCFGGVNTMHVLFIGFQASFTHGYGLLEQNDTE